MRDLSRLSFSNAPRMGVARVTFNSDRKGIATSAHRRHSRESPIKLPTDAAQSSLAPVLRRTSNLPQLLISQFIAFGEAVRELGVMSYYDQNSLLSLMQLQQQGSNNVCRFMIEIAGWFITQ